MNFVKSTWKSLFKKQETIEKQKANEKEKETQQKIEQNPQQNEQEIPLEILEELFNLSSQLVKQSKKITNDNVKLKIYALYKQSKEGDCNIPKPQMFDLYGKAKWNAWDQLRGMKKTEAMMQYIRVVNEADPEISKKIGQHFSGHQKAEDSQKHEQRRHETLGYQKVQKVDYSDGYSHPYFKLIEKGDDIQNIDHQKLLEKNNQPQVYPLHFAIDKERVDLVNKFMQILTVSEIESMKDSEGTSILEYAELIENEQILKIVKKKLDK